MKKTIGGKIKHLFQGTAGMGPGMANLHRAQDPLGIQQSPFLSRIFDPSTDLATFFNTMFKAALVIGAMLAVLRLGYAGFLYMTSDVWGNKSKAKDVIQETVLGLLLLLGVWLILNQINPNLLNLDILRSVKPLERTNNSTQFEYQNTPAGPIPGIQAGQESQTAPYAAP